MHHSTTTTTTFGAGLLGLGVGGLVRLLELPVVRNPDTGPGGAGATCDILTDAGPSQCVYNSQALECPSRLCIRAGRHNL